MKILILVIALIAAVALPISGQSCSDAAKEVAPDLTAAAKLKYSENLESAARNAVTQPTADNIIWYARRKGYLGRYKDAVDALTIALKQFPNDARMYRHRGHRYMTLRCFDDAIKDFEKAAKLVKGKPDEVEPDGVPNAQNIPTSTLQSNIWYHLGLAYYLKGDFKKALAAYKECMKVSKNSDMLAATSHWYYMTLRRLEKNKDAERVLEPFNGDFEVIENADYLKLLRLYRGEVKADTLMSEMGEKAETLGNASLGYGLGNWYLYNGDRDKAMDIFRRIVGGNQWASFGYIAAEGEMNRGGSAK
ncbi:MAG: tetratricopeptide repeat protein [Pyrinomonadaceae bacterium]